MSAKSKYPIRSMTGYARVRHASPDGEITFSLRSVNHRGLDVHFHTAPDLDPYEGALRKAISTHVTRGHVDVRAAVRRSGAAESVSWNRPLLEAWLAAFRRAREDYHLPGEPDLNAALRIPGMLGDPGGVEPAADLETRLVAACEEALAILNEFRSREGAETAAVLRGYAATIRDAAEEMQTRLNEKLAELLRGSTIDPQRLAQEAAILADRGDIGEEITRLKIHSGQLEALLETGGEIGKKLDFLLQEMHRETNTILSKSNGAGEHGRRVTDLALGVKSDIEKIREQSLNLE
jgi:uncharacterized protein (TIGR00255 family)